VSAARLLLPRLEISRIDLDHGSGCPPAAHRAFAIIRSGTPQPAQNTNPGAWHNKNRARNQARLHTFVVSWLTQVNAPHQASAHEENANHLSARRKPTEAMFRYARAVGTAAIVLERVCVPGGRRRKPAVAQPFLSPTEAP
jgi:hypothetical protein